MPSGRAPPRAGIGDSRTGRTHSCTRPTHPLGDSPFRGHETEPPSLRGTSQPGIHGWKDRTPPLRIDRRPRARRRAPADGSPRSCTPLPPPRRGLPARARTLARTASTLRRCRTNRRTARATAVQAPHGTPDPRSQAQAAADPRTLPARRPIRPSRGQDGCDSAKTQDDRT